MTARNIHFPAFECSLVSENPGKVEGTEEVGARTFSLAHDILAPTTTVSTLNKGILRDLWREIEKREGCEKSGQNEEGKIGGLPS